MTSLEHLHIIDEHELIREFNVYDLIKKTDTLLISVVITPKSNNNKPASDV